VLTVNATDKDHHPELTCILTPADHPSITKNSAIWFKKWKPRNATAMGIVLASGNGVRLCPNLSDPLLRRIISGMVACEDVEDHVKVKFGLKG
jgi:hypothetical protein